MRAFMRLKFNRPIDTNTDYISPGGYEVELNNGIKYQFDFLEHFSNIEEKDKSILNCSLRHLDTDVYPESRGIDWDNIKKFIEFYVYLGEEGESPNLFMIDVLEFTVEDDNHVVHRIPDKVLKTVPINLRNLFMIVDVIRLAGEKALHSDYMKKWINNSAEYFTESEIHSLTSLLVASINTNTTGGRSTIKSIIKTDFSDLNGRSCKTVYEIFMRAYNNYHFDKIDY